MPLLRPLSSLYPYRRLDLVVWVRGRVVLFVGGPGLGVGVVGGGLLGAGGGGGGLERGERERAMRVKSGAVGVRVGGALVHTGVGEEGWTGVGLGVSRRTPTMVAVVFFAVRQERESRVDRESARQQLISSLTLISFSSVSFLFCVETLFLATLQPRPVTPAALSLSLSLVHERRGRHKTHTHTRTKQNNGNRRGWLH